ncbi:MAG TPA: hypothetical protein PLI09_23275 [Candidatus Hydrogenedentes bacterium]|nr:hypothetical protein [Candidatus Hydrogenedentota bacterium]
MEDRGGGGPEKSKPEILSFQALNADLDEDQRPTAALVSAKPKMGLTDDQKEALNRKVLTASAPKGTPIWISSLVGGIAAWVVFWPAVRSTLFTEIRDILLMIVMVVALGTVLWASAGILQHGATRKERVLCVIGFLLGLSAVVFTVLLYRSTH